MTPPVQSGLERCLASPPDLLRGARLGLLANHASLDAGFRTAPDLLAARFPGQLHALLSPQHGLWGEQQDNMIETPHATHPRLGVPIYSLYAEARRPSAAMLDGLDCLVVDLQDVGTRVYTFVWTLLHCLEACAEASVAVLVLDRPNPLGGVEVEGPELDPEFASFVGLRAMPMRHGLTLAEAARWLNRSIGADLHTVAMQGWERGMTFAATGCAWVPPSPNLPRLEGVDVYPGQVLLEGTNLSEGRGTTTPFEVLGAPWLDPFALADALADRALPGVVCRPYRFEPTFHKFAGESCGGVFLHITNAQAFRPYRTTLTLLAAARAANPAEFAWRPPPYEYETTRMPIDILTGGSALREALDAGAVDAEALAALDAAAWWDEVRDALLY